MARKKPAKQARKAKAGKTAKKKAAAVKASTSARASADRSARRPKAAKKAARPVKKAAKKAAKPVARKSPKKAAAKQSTARKAAPQTTKAVVKAPARSAAANAGKKPNLDRPRKTVADIHGIPSSLGMAGVASAAASGRAELRDRLRKNTSASPALTSGDVDADWESAEAIGDEAPGGDNPTPDQDVVDEIGRALGVEYEDDEELQGGAEITDRDKHRWELDPSSKDDFDDEN